MSTCGVIYLGRSPWPAPQRALRSSRSWHEDRFRYHKRCPPADTAADHLVELGSPRPPRMSSPQPQAAAHLLVTVSVLARESSRCGDGVTAALGEEGGGSAFAMTIQWR